MNERYKTAVENIEAMAVFAAIATFGSKWNEVSVEDLDHRARAIQYRFTDVMKARENERLLYT